MKKRSESIDCLRIICFMWIMAFHARLYYGLGTGIVFIDQIISVGPVGCTIFFVLSGFFLRTKFCKTNLIEKDLFILYVKKKPLNIYLTYIVMCVIAILCHYRFPTTKKILYALLPVQITMSISWVGNCYEYFFNNNCWFLSSIFFIYLFFPFFNTIANYLTRKRIALIIIMILSELVYTYHVVSGNGFFNYYPNPLYRIPEFLFGVFLSDYMNGRYIIKKKLFFIGHVLAVAILFLLIYFSHFVLQANYNLYNIIILPFCFIWVFLSYVDESFETLMHKIGIQYVSAMGMYVYLAQSISIMWLERHDVKHKLRVFLIMTICIACFVTYLIIPFIRKHVNYGIVKRGN